MAGFTRIKSHYNDRVFVGDEAEKTYYKHELEYVKLHLDNVEPLFKLTKNEIGIFFTMVNMVGKKDIFTIYREEKDYISKKLNTTHHAVEKAISNLIKYNIMKRTSVGHFIFNPEIFSKGSWHEINKKIIQYKLITKK